MYKKEHKQLIDNFLEFLNSSSNDFILKGDTALYKGYGLDRLSKNIDFDAQQGTCIREIVDSFCSINDCTFHEEKNTVSAEKYTINYRQDCKPLEIGVTRRATAIDKGLYTERKNILIYKLNPLLQIKISTYIVRKRIRDLYDIAFICNRHFESLSPETTLQLENMIEYEEIEQDVYTIHTQKDELVDYERLKLEILNMYDKLEMLL